MLRAVAVCSLLLWLCVAACCCYLMVFAVAGAVDGFVCCGSLLELVVRY